MLEGVIYTVSAPSGAGKTSLVRAVLEELDGIALSVSHTTRARRPGEVDGQDYHFVAAAQFQHLLAQGEFVEHAEVFGNLYGTSRGELQHRRQGGGDVILEIDWQGARQVRRHFPEALSIFVLPPSRAALEERLRGRGQDAPEVVRSRMAGAIREIGHYDECDFLIVNDDFQTALQEICSIVRSQRLALARQRERHTELIASLLA